MSDTDDEILAKIDLEEISKKAEESKKQERFAEVADEQIDELLSDVQSKNTKYKTTYALNIFKGIVFTLKLSMCVYIINHSHSKR